ncbi:hypothetical protein D3C84_1209110 [compost metagenome]
MSRADHRVLSRRDSLGLPHSGVTLGVPERGKTNAEPETGQQPRQQADNQHRVLNRCQIMQHMISQQANGDGA